MTPRFCSSAGFFSAEHLVFGLSSIVILFFAACGGGGGGSTAADREATAFYAVSAVTGADGAAAVYFEVPAGTNKISITSTTDTQLATDYVVSEDGTRHLDYQGEFLANSLSFMPFVSSVSVPSRDFDPPVAGGAFTIGVTAASAVYGTNFDPAPGREVIFTILARSDSDLRSGQLPLNIIFIGPAVSNEINTITQAVSEIRTIFSSQAGISLDIRDYSFDGPLAIPAPTNGAALYGDVSMAVRSPAVNVCIGIDVADMEVLGVAGGIPGAPVPSVSSCVAVSLSDNAGPDGAFDPGEVLLLAETIAHETGHFLGLFHPVEMNWAAFDPLTDTPQCSSSGDCTSSMGSNLMFPVPVANGAGGTIRQNVLTAQQAGVMNLYAAVE